MDYEKDVISTFIADLNGKIEKTDNHLTRTTKTILLLCFIAFTLLYYPKKELLNSPVTLENNIVPYTILFLLCVTFGMWGYYLWRIHKLKIILGKYSRRYLQNTNLKKIDFDETYKSDSVFELLTKWDNKAGITLFGHLMPILLISFILSIHHTAIILYSYLLFTISPLGATIATIIVVLFLSSFYYFYFRQMKLLYSNETKIKDEYKIVMAITFLNIILTITFCTLILHYKNPIKKQDSHSNENSQSASISQ